MTQPAISRAMVLAAGRGERLRPLTDTLPKPLVEVGGRAMLDRQLDMLAAAGVTHAVVNSSWLAEVLHQHVAKREGAPQVMLSHEPQRLETGGGIAKALPQLGAQPFYVSNADVVVVDAPHENAFLRLAKAWDAQRMDALLLLHPREKAIGFDGAGDFFLEADGRLRRRGEAASAPYVFTGAQIVHPRLFAGELPQGAFSMNVLYDKERTIQGILPRIYGLVHYGDWLHVGDPQGLAQAEDYYAHVN